MIRSLQQFGRRLRLLVRRRAAERSMDAELRHHLECEMAAHERAGLAPGEARRQALRDFGSVESVKERGRDARGLRPLEDLAQDVRVALRLLRRHRGHTITAGLTFALGIGAVTAIYSLVYGVLLRPLPYPEPEQLVVVWERNIPRGRDQNVVSLATYERWRAEATSFASMAAVIPTTVTHAGPTAAERLPGADVTPGYFSVLGVPPAIGREFDEEDARHGASVILSDGLWRRHFKGDPAIVGRSVRLSGRSVTVVGVMPASFDPPRAGWLGQQDLWFPLVATSQARSWGRAFIVVARLRAGVPVRDARAEMTGLAARHERESAANEGWSATVVPLAEQIAGGTSTSLLVLMAGAVLLMLMAVANVATLSLSLTGQRARELSVRRALGATDRRIFRQMFTQSLLLGTLGASAGAALAFPGVQLLLALLPPDIPRAASVAVDGPVLAMAAAVALAATILFGTIAAVRGRNLSASSAFAAPHGSRVTGRSGGGALVVAEIALAVALGVMAMLMARSFAGLRDVDLGFEPGNLVIARVALPGDAYPTPERQRQFFAALTDRLRGLDGITGAGIISGRPFGGIGPATVAHDAVRPAAPPGQDPSVDVRYVGDGAFEALGMRIEAGVTFDGRDASAEPPRAVISASLARQLWPSRDAVGRSIAINMYDGLTPTVAGVVNDIHLVDARTPPRPTVYLSSARFPGAVRDVVIRISVPAEQAIPSLRAAVGAIDPAVPIYQVTTMPALVDSALASDRLTMYLLGAFATVALALAGVGVFGVFAGDVNSRRKEIGIRLALGAAESSIVRLLLGAALRRATIGLGAGLVMAAIAGRGMEAVLFGVSATDIRSYATVMTAVTALAIAATLLPAWQALHASPLRSLREE